MKKKCLFICVLLLMLTSCGNDQQKGNVAKLSVDVGKTTDSSVSEELNNNNLLSKEVRISEIVIKIPKSWEMTSAGTAMNGFSVTICDPGVDTTDLLYTQASVTYDRSIENRTPEEWVDFIRENSVTVKILESEVVEINGMKMAKVTSQILGTMLYSIWEEDRRRVELVLPDYDNHYYFTFTYRLNNKGEEELIENIINSISIYEEKEIIDEEYWAK